MELVDETAVIAQVWALLKPLTPRARARALQFIANKHDEDAAASAPVGPTAQAVAPVAAAAPAAPAAPPAPATPPAAA